ncbi:MAG: alpha/beta hydrolase [Acidobacteria bacterium]|nr:alpha/beta hydrolase [Acidobacteriota bacterium]
MRLAFSIALVALVFLLLLRMASRPMLFPGSTVPLVEEERLKKTFPAVRVVDYQASDGNALRGAFFHDASAERPVIVSFHGNAESAANGLPLGWRLFSGGYDVFLAEYRGFGGAPGSPSEEGLYKDGQGALRWLELKGIAPSRVILMGRSLGSGVAVELARSRPVKAVVLVSPYTSVTDLGRTLVGPLAPLIVRDRFDSLSKIAAIGAPVLIVHGARDEVIPVEMGQRLSRSRPGIRYVELPGASHNDIPDLASVLLKELPALLSRPTGS